MINKTRVYALALVEALEKTRGTKWGEVIARLKKLLKKRGDVKLMGALRLEFHKRWEQRKGKTAAFVHSGEMSAGARESLRRALEKKGFVPQEDVDPRVIGGVAIFLGNEYMIDNTVRGRLKRLIQRLPHG